MPWAPELFSAPVLARLEEQRQRKLVDVPFWDGLMTGELDALIGSFAGQPEVHHPVRGRIRGAREFGAFVTELNAWFARRQVSVEEVDRVAAQRHGFDEVILHVDGTTGRIGLPVATVADKRFDRRIKELRMYYSSRPLTGHRATRPPLLQPDPELHASDVVSEYQAALAAGDVDAIVAAFEPGAYVREPAGGQSHPPRPRWSPRVLRAVVLEWRRNPAGALRGDRRRTRVCFGVQRCALGQDGAAAAGRARCLRARSEWQARCSTHVRRHRTAAPSGGDGLELTPASWDRWDAAQVA